METFRELGDVIQSLQTIPTMRTDIASIIDELKRNQLACDDIDELYYAERLVLEKRFHERCAAYFAKRCAIVNGDIGMNEDGSLQPVVPGANDATASEEKEILPHFWLLALGNHPVTEQLLEADDVPALEQLADVQVSYDETCTTFTLSFIFRENIYFHNEILTKRYTLADVFCAEGPSLEKIEGCTIDWKEGKNLCVEKVVKKRKIKKGKSKGQYKTDVKYVQKPSFFRFFTAPKSDKYSAGDEVEDLEDEDADPIAVDRQDGDGEEDAESMELNEEEDYAVAHAIRFYIVPDAVLWYTGEAREADNRAKVARVDSTENVSSDDEDGDGH